MKKYRHSLMLFALINAILISPCYSAFFSPESGMPTLLMQDKAMELANDTNSCTVTSISIPVGGVCPPATTFTWNRGSLHITPGGHYQLNGSNIYNACSLVAGGVSPGSYTITATFSTTGCGTSSLSCTTTLNCNGATCDNTDCIPT